VSWSSIAVNYEQRYGVRCDMATLMIPESPIRLDEFLEAVAGRGDHFTN
jgi:hypothetical protein